MTPLAIRASRADDVPALTAIYRPAVLHGTASFEIEPPDEAEMARRRAALIEAGFPHLVAERGGVVVGYAYAGAYRPRPAYRSTVECSIYIAPEAQRAGVGRALLEALVARATEDGFHQMIAVIGDSAQTPSIELHRACGFRLIGIAERVGFKHGRWLDQVLMQRELAPRSGDAAGR
jgi:phosphinothricin acetyltransferase